MNELWTQILENVSFVVGVILIIAALGVASVLVERLLPEKRQISKARRISIIAICAAIATVLHILDFPLIFLAPGFYK